jgi:LPXTG-site transpeptidase (sortase) family protein
MAKRTRRLVSHLLILAGLALLVYPAGTWGYTWLQQERLEGRLEAAYPQLAPDAGSFFTEPLQPPAAAESTAGTPVDKAEEPLDGLREAVEGYRQTVGDQTVGDQTVGDQTVGDQTGPLGKLYIPRIGLEVVLMKGTGRKELREGPGHWPETPLPGMGGNFVVSGHRSTYGAPFLKLDQLAPGDEIGVVLPYAALRYRVTRSLVVRPDEVAVVAPSGQEEIFLVTCHPVYSARQRLVVRGELISFELLAG